MLSNSTSDRTKLGQAELSAIGAVDCPARRAALPAASVLSDEDLDSSDLYTPVSTSRQVYYAQANDRTYVSPSQGELRKLLNSPLDPGRLALALCSNLPSALRSEPFWQGVHALPPGSSLNLNSGIVIASRRWRVSSVEGCDASEAQHLLRQALTNAIARRVDQYESISSDLSGGMDSTSLAYLLSSMVDAPYYYHSQTADEKNRDTAFARRAANELRGTYVELDSFTSTISAFSGDDGSLLDSHDGPWSWGSNAVHLRKLLSDAASRGIQGHLTGLGGDELFSVLPALALTLRGRARKRRSSRAIVNMAKKQRWSTVATLRAATSRRPLDAELLQRVRSNVPGDDGPDASFAWAPGFTLSPFATTKSRRLVEAKVTQAVESGVSAWFRDKYRHQVIEAVIFQGEVIRQMNLAFAAVGVTVEAPLIDDQVVSLVLGLPPELSVGHQISKPLLAAAVRHLVPAWVLERSDKGEYSSDLFDEMKRRRGALAKTFADSYLIDNGYVDPVKVRAAIEAPIVGTGELFELEQLAAVERWVRRNA